MVIFGRATRPEQKMNKPKFAVEKIALDLSPEAAGMAHGLNLLLLAVGKTNPSAGSLLDEFTSMHAEYLTELRALAMESPEYTRMLKQFSDSAREIYQRLRLLDAEQSAQLRNQMDLTGTLTRVH
jgi:hypothetical protein